MSKAVSMKKKKYVTMDEALEGTVEFHDTIDIPKKYTGLNSSFDLDIAVIRTDKKCSFATPGCNYVSGLIIYEADKDTQLVVKRNRYGAPSYEYIGEGSLVACCHSSYYKWFTSKKKRDLILRYALLRHYFSIRGRLDEQKFPNADAAVCAYLFVEDDEKPSDIIDAMELINKRTIQECKAYLKALKKAEAAGEADIDWAEEIVATEAASTTA